MSRFKKLDDLELLKEAGIILETVHSRGNINTNDLVIRVVDIINEKER